MSHPFRSAGLGTTQGPAPRLPPPRGTSRAAAAALRARERVR
jgi:hypothetical protein